MKGVLGIKPLDDLLGAPPTGSRLLLLNDPGTDGEQLMRHATAHALAGGARVIYVSWQRPARRVRQRLELDGVSGPSLEQVQFVEAYTDQLDTTERISLRPEGSVPALAQVLTRLADDDPSACLVLDSLSAIFDEAGGDGQDWHGLLRQLSRFQYAVCLFTRWPYLEPLERFMAPFEGRIRIRAVESGVIRNQAVAVERADWREHVDSAPRIVRSIDGKLDVAIPKLVVTGPEAAGKTTFVRAVSKIAQGTDRSGTTVALDRGRFEDDGYRVEIWGTPGQERFEPLLDPLLESATAAIVIVDASDPASFPRAGQFIDRVQRLGAHLIVIANKQDQAEALPPMRLRGALGLGTHVPVIACSANADGAAREALLGLLGRLSAVPTAAPDHEVPA